MNVLADTSVWSLALRRKSHSLSLQEGIVVDELTELIREGRCLMAGLVRQELLSGMRSFAQFESLRHTLRSFPDVRMDTPDYEDAAQAGNHCRAKGIAVSTVDILLCAMAIRREWAIFTTDPDFSRYASVLPLKLHTPRT